MTPDVEKEVGLVRAGGVIKGTGATDRSGRVNVFARRSWEG
jgi:hypothetical protein